jgi:hypothetical protein
MAELIHRADLAEDAKFVGVLEEGYQPGSTVRIVTESVS